MILLEMAKRWFTYALTNGTHSWDITLLKVISVVLSAPNRVTLHAPNSTTASSIYTRKISHFDSMIVRTKATQAFGI
jgi:hypothetical protein